MTAIRMGRRCSHARVRRDEVCLEVDFSWVFGGVWVIWVFDSMKYREINGWGLVGVDKAREQRAHSRGTRETKSF